MVNQKLEDALSVTSDLIHDLVFNPMEAIIEAQAMAAQKWISSLTAITSSDDEPLFFKKVEGELKLNMVEFSIDLAGDTDLKARIKYPLLLLVPLPSLHVNDFSIDFTLKVDLSATSQAKIKAKQNRESSNNFNIGYNSKHFNIGYKTHGSLTSNNTSSKTTTSKDKIEATYKFSVRGNADTAPGYQQFLEIVETAVKQELPSSLGSEPEPESAL